MLLYTMCVVADRERWGHGFLDEAQLALHLPQWGHAAPDRDLQEGGTGLLRLLHRGPAECAVGR